MKNTFIVACLATTAFANSIKSLHNLAQESANLPDTDFMNLAQLDNPTCASTSARNKAPLEDFFTILSGSAKFTDSDFTASKTSLLWPGEKAHETTIGRWQRATTIRDGLSLWGKNDVNPKDSI